MMRIRNFMLILLLIPCALCAFFHHEGHLNGLLHINNFVLRDSLVYVSNGTEGISIVNVADPAHPFVRGTYASSLNAMGLTISGNYAYVVDSNNKLKIYNISNPANPSYSGFCNLPYFAYIACIYQNYAYISGSNRIQIVDIANPQLFESISSCAFCLISIGQRQM